MKSLKIGAVAAMLIASTAFGQSVMTYTVELGGNNQAADWKGACNRLLFSGGSSGDGQTWSVGDVVTWAVKVAVSGVHSNGIAPSGAANMVASLELYKDGVLTAVSANGAEGTWVSTINDGTASGCGGTDPLELASFPVAWTVDGINGRVIDGPANGGPLGGNSGTSTAYWQYPSAAGHPAGSTAAPGTLVGMGAGYANFIPADWFSGAGLGGNSTSGIGVSTATACAQALGTGPVFEGQLDTTGMDAGTYVLKVVPGTGNNILNLPIDDIIGECTWANNTAFALKVDQSQGDEITFHLEGGVEPCVRTVVGVHVTYVGGNAAFNNLPATDKSPYRAGTGAATFANVSSYSRGINGLLVDLQRGAGCGAAPTLSAADFAFKYGNTNTPSTWVGAVAAPAVSYIGEVTPGVDRFKLQWANNAFPTRNWLQVKVLANANTNLAADDISYYGLLIGEVGLGNSGTAMAVVSADYNAAFNNQIQTLPGTQPITNIYDFNRDRNVTSADYNLSYNERGSLLNAAQRLNLLNNPAAP